MYLMNKKQQKTDRKIGFFLLKPLSQGRELKLISLCSVNSAGFEAPLAGAWIEISDAGWCILSLKEAPLAGAWIEISSCNDSGVWESKPLSQVRELKYNRTGRPWIQKWKPLSQGVNWNFWCACGMGVCMEKPLSQGRELKSVLRTDTLQCGREAPLAGAWIEIQNMYSWYPVIWSPSRIFKEGSRKESLLAVKP